MAEKCHRLEKNYWSLSSDRETFALTGSPNAKADIVTLWTTLTF